MPHFTAPEMAPRVASQEASVASSCFESFIDGILFWILCRFLLLLLRG